MSVRKLPTGEWICDLRPNGRNGTRIRKKFATKHEATAYEAHILEQVDDRPWLGEKRDDRRLSDLVKTWYSAHGITLSDGQKRQTTMLFMCDALGDPLATSFTSKDFSQYRERRLSGELRRTNKLAAVSPRTINLELAYVRAVFNELERLGEWKLPNPLKNVREYRTHESEMSFLSHEEIPVLLSECANSRAKDLLLIVKIALATGARWSEVEKLTGANVTPYRITYTKTKGRRSRTLPITKELYDEIPRKSGRLFIPCYSAFREAIERAGIELPAGQQTHVLRHTFASHFMMNGGNILVLQKALGHTDIKMTMRYAHFSPSHLEEVVKLNPLLSVAPNVHKVSTDNDN